jgi:hypothetical protein
VIDLGKVSDVPGLERLLKNLKTANDNVRGFAYELQLGAKFVDEGKNVQYLSKLALDGTDIDIIADGVFYQAKSTLGALEGPNEVRTWIHRALASGAQQIRYVMPHGFDIPEEIQKIFNRHSILVERIPFR